MTFFEKYNRTFKVPSVSTQPPTSFLLLLAYCSEPGKICVQETFRTSSPQSKVAALVTLTLIGISTRERKGRDGREEKKGKKRKISNCICFGGSQRLVKFAPTWIFQEI